MAWAPTPKERQVWLRIRLSVAAWAYEVHDVSIMTDEQYDRLCLEVDTKLTTGNRRMDKFFRDHFDPSTGQWVHKHPEKGWLEGTYQRFWGEEDRGRGVDEGAPFLPLRGD